MSRRIAISSTNIHLTDRRVRLQGDGFDLALFNVEGKVFAIDDSCPHGGASLLMGKIEDGTVRCPAHGLRFDLATGCMRSGTLAVRCYPVENIDGILYVVLGIDDETIARDE